MFDPERKKRRFLLFWKGEIGRGSAPFFLSVGYIYHTIEIGCA